MHLKFIVPLDWLNKLITLITAVNLTSMSTNVSYKLNSKVSHDQNNPKTKKTKKNNYNLCLTFLMTVFFHTIPKSKNNFGNFWNNFGKN